MNLVPDLGERRPFAGWVEQVVRELASISVGDARDEVPAVSARRELHLGDPGK
jgi:hypothetical protein